jgi:thiosulfate/3-mercaptopyruvate sulfurtransferase
MTTTKFLSRPTGAPAPVTLGVTTKWLIDQIRQNPALRVVDVCSSQSAQQIALLPCALKLDWEQSFSTGPHLRPSPLVFAAVMSQLGVGDEDTIVLYDEGQGHRALNVLRWFKRFGHPRAFVLIGGRAGWLRQGYSLVGEPTRFSPSSFTVCIEGAFERKSSLASATESGSMRGGRRSRRAA